LYAAKRRKPAKSGLHTTASPSDSSSQNCCLCASAGESRATIANPSADNTTASAGSTSSRANESGCQSTHTKESNARSASIQAGPTEPAGASRRIKAETPSAKSIGTARVRTIIPAATS
jgi:hypothetical protein